MGRVQPDKKKAMFWLGKAARAGYRESYLEYAQALEEDGEAALAFRWYNHTFANPPVYSDGVVDYTRSHAAERLYFVYQNGELGQAKNKNRAAAYRKYAPWELGYKKEGKGF